MGDGIDSAMVGSRGCRGHGHQLRRCLRIRQLGDLRTQRPVRHGLRTYSRRALLSAQRSLVGAPEGSALTAMSAKPFRAALVANTLGFGDASSLSVIDLPLTDGTCLKGTSAVAVTGDYALVASSTKPFRAALAANTLGLTTADSLDYLAQSSARVPGRPLGRLWMHPPILGRGGIALEGAEVNPYYLGFQQRHIPLERVPGHCYGVDVLNCRVLQQ